MEINTMNWGQKSLINELTQGRELVNQLRVQLDPSSSSTSELLITKLLCSFDKSLLMLNRVKIEDEHQLTEPTAVIATESPRSVRECPSSEFDYEVKEKSKKRKIIPKWTQQVRGCIGSGLEGPLDDEYSWRKYGSKDIHGAKHPRDYFRCTYRNTQGCSAIKQVQRSDRDPTIFSVTYQGRHTCNNQASHLISGQSPNKQNQDQRQNKSQETYINFQTGCEVKTKDLDNEKLFGSSSFSFISTSPIDFSEKEKHIFSSLTPDNNFMGSFSPPDISPTTSESDYWSPYGMNSFGGQIVQTSESDLNEIISASSSTFNSQILDFDLDFSLDLDSHFSI